MAGTWFAIRLLKVREQMAAQIASETRPHACVGRRDRGAVMVAPVASVALQLDLYQRRHLSHSEAIQLGSALRNLGALDFLDPASWPVVSSNSGGYLTDLDFINVGGVYTAADYDGWRYTVQRCGFDWFAAYRTPDGGRGGLGVDASLPRAELTCEAHRRARRAVEQQRRTAAGRRRLAEILGPL